MDAKASHHLEGLASDRTTWRSSLHLETQKRHTFDHHLEVESPFGDSKRRVTREKGVTRPDDATPKNATRVGPEVLGTFSARARREDKKQCGVCD